MVGFGNLTTKTTRAILSSPRLHPTPPNNSRRCWSKSPTIASRAIAMSSGHDALSLKERKKALRQTLKSTLSRLSEDDIAEQSRIAQTALLSLPQYRSAKRVGVYLSMPVGEARTELIVRDALESGKSLFVPYIYRTNSGLTKEESGSKARPRRSMMEMLRLDSIDQWENLKPDSWGIPSLSAESIQERENAMGGHGIPNSDTVIVSKDEIKTGGGEQQRDFADGEEDSSTNGLDLIVVPGVAFDTGMNRLGHGAGFYDVYLSRFCADGKRRKPFLAGLCLSEQFLSQLGEIPVTDEDWLVDAVVSGDGSIKASQEGI